LIIDVEEDLLIDYRLLMIDYWKSGTDGRVRKVKNPQT